MADHEIRTIRLDENEDFSDTQSYGQRIVTPVRFSTDPRDIGWVRENIPCQTACPQIPTFGLYTDHHGTALWPLLRVEPAGQRAAWGAGRICSRPCGGLPTWLARQWRTGCDLSPEACSRRSQAVGPPHHGKSVHPTGKKIAIVGAGPAGLAAAHDLTTLGHDVTIFEREKRPGGMLSYGIPEFRLPRDLLQVEIHNAIRLGVDLKTGVSIGSGENDVKVTSLLREYDAVLLATGCASAIPLPLRNIESGVDISASVGNVENGLDFLMELHRGEKSRSASGLCGRRRLYCTGLRAGGQKTGCGGGDHPYPHD